MAMVVLNVANPGRVFAPGPGCRFHPEGRKNYMVLVEAGLVDSDGAALVMAGAAMLVSGAGVLVMAGAAMLVSAAGVGVDAELVMVLSVLLLQPVRARGRLRVRTARRVQVRREHFMVPPC
jgi:hypothetical protein